MGARTSEIEKQIKNQKAKIKRQKSPTVSRLPFGSRHRSAAIFAF
jgi:hypothetical protein